MVASSFFVSLLLLSRDALERAVWMRDKRGELLLEVLQLMGHWMASRKMRAENGGKKNKSAEETRPRPWSLLRIPGRLPLLRQSV